LIELWCPLSHFVEVIEPLLEVAVSRDIRNTEVVHNPLVLL